MTLPPEPENSRKQNCSRCQWVAWIVLGLISILTAMRPGDAPFVADEPRIVALAMKLNQTPRAWMGMSLPFMFAREDWRDRRRFITGRFRFGFIRGCWC